MAKSIEDEFNKKYPSTDKKGIVVELWPVPYRDDFVELSALYIPKEHRGKGIGSEIMNRIVQYADENNKIIGATPSTDFGASSVNRIRDFNKRFGFVRNKGRDVDFTISNTMYRKPKTA
jgi:GNAT superfamily N-acetyltransferase